MKASMRMENSLRRSGQLFVCGIDEVGRGSLAGPLVAAAVVLPSSWRRALTDSKLLSAARREELSEYITEKSLGYGIGWVDNTEVDLFGLTEAVRMAYLRALEDLECEFSSIIIDGNYDYLSEYKLSQTIVKADQKVSCVAAASIIAKVARDQYMFAQTQQYPGYGFESNVGYGTKKHLESLARKGPSDLHRKSFCRGYL